MECACVSSCGLFVCKRACRKRVPARPPTKNVSLVSRDFEPEHVRRAIGADNDLITAVQFSLSS